MSMSLPTIALVPLLSIQAAGAQSQTYVPYLLLAVPLVLAFLLLVVFGRQRRHQNRDHDE